MRSNVKVKLLSGLLTVMTLTCMTGFAQDARADVSWADILKPLVTDLVVPTMKKGIANWQAKKSQNTTDSTTEVYVDPYEAHPETASAAISSDNVEVTTTSTVEEASSAWKLPEEPTN